MAAAAAAAAGVWQSISSCCEVAQQRQLVTLTTKILNHRCHRNNYPLANEIMIL